MPAPEQVGLTVAQAQSIVDRFMAEYRGHIAVTANIKATQEEIYGPDAARDKIGYRIDAAYHPARAIFTLAASNMGDEGAVRRALRHELLGHYGLNTFNPEEKREFLGRVLETRGEASLAHIWAYVDEHYAKLTDLGRAEEVFAFVAEEERSFLGKAWDRTRHTLQGMLKAVGLTDGRLTISELRIEARAIAAGIKEGHRQQMTFPKDDQSQFRLSPAEHDAIFDDIALFSLTNTKPVNHPTAVLLGGQPGAGKAGLSSRVMDEFGGNTIKVDADELRKHHPQYLQLMHENDRMAADRTHPDAGAWSVKLTNLAIKNRRNLLIDGTMRDPESLAKLCSRLHSAGYRVEARVLAVDSLVSRMSIHMRYELQRESNGFGRWVNRDKHDQAYTGLPLTVERLEAGNLVDTLRVFSRNGTELYARRLSEGGSSPAGGKQRITQERERVWSPQEIRGFSYNLEVIEGKMLVRRASPGERAELDGLRSEYRTQYPTDLSQGDFMKRPKPGY
uniref:zeta toxin family protein n=1 Tax=Pseudomonas syringae TaxID=317 RepID=UPI001E48E0CC|nr:zeta toxin family protein [Pseudomonas syringae]QOU99734.1 hypothetical protein [Pseudomonas syringae pv. actinidiae]